MSPAATITANANANTNANDDGTATRTATFISGVHQAAHQNKRRRLQNSAKSIKKEPYSSPTSTVTMQYLDSIPCNNGNIFDSKTIADIDAIDAIFVHILDFFVGSKNIDAETILNIMKVNKRWNHLSTSQRFWRNVPIFRSSPLDSLDTRLVRYAKIEKYTHEDCWKVRDRATGKLVKLEVSVLGVQERCYQQRHLREVALRKRVDCLEKEAMTHLNILSDWDVCDGHALHWHECPTYTLKALLQKKSLKSNPQVMKTIVWQMLLGLKVLHESGVGHCSLTADSVHVFYKGSSGSVPLIKIAGFENNNDLHILDADEAKPLFDASSVSESADISAVGAVFLFMLQEDTTEISSASKLQEYTSIIGIDGIDLLSRLLYESPSTKFSTSKAIQHRYFHNFECPLQVVSTNSSKDVQGLTLQQHAENEDWSQNHREFVLFEPYQAAAMVDWLFEIATVFQLSTRTVFVAVGYYNICCQVSVVGNILDTQETGTKKYQLLAATCLYIASKCEDCHHVLVGNLSFSADRMFNEADLISMERRVLDAIEWNLYLPTIYDFARSFMSSIEVNSGSQAFWMALYISELALATVIHVEFKPSMIAACVLVLSRLALNAEEIWPARLEKVSGYQWNDLSLCLLKLSILLEVRHRFDEISITDRRYTKVSRMSVASDIPIKTITTLEQLQAIDI
jgi:hypothetical protein